MPRKLGLPVPVITLLAALAVPRVVTHDLDIFPKGSFVNSLLVFVPLLISLTVLLWWRVPNPFLTLTVIGIAYGVMLAIGHQLLWEARWDGEPPRLGGNLEGVLDPGLESVVVRIFAFFSSIITGTIVGAIVGLVAWVIERVRRGFRDGRGA
jgi:hypothetical protein